jgi:hypothetical protein
MSTENSAHRTEPYSRQAAQLADKRMAYVELAAELSSHTSPAFLFLHDNQSEVTARGSHFIQEDSGPGIARAVADWASGPVRG